MCVDCITLGLFKFLQHFMASYRTYGQNCLAKGGATCIP